MAASRPSAVASSASAMPGATTERLVFFEAAIAWNEVMMPHTVPKRPMKGPAEPTVASTRSRRSSRSTSRASVTSITRSMRPPSPCSERTPEFVGALPLAHRRHEQRRDAVRVARRDLLVELLERLARPEHGLELVHLPLGAGVEQELVDDDRPAPDRGDEQSEDHQLDDDVRLPEQGEQRESARRPGQCGLYDFRIHESGSPNSDLRRLLAAECVQSAARQGLAAAPQVQHFMVNAE